MPNNAQQCLKTPEGYLRIVPNTNFWSNTRFQCFLVIPLFSYARLTQPTYSLPRSTCHRSLLLTSHVPVYLLLLSMPRNAANMPQEYHRMIQRIRHGNTTHNTTTILQEHCRMTTRTVQEHLRILHNNEVHSLQNASICRSISLQCCLPMYYFYLLLPLLPILTESTMSSAYVLLYFLIILLQHSYSCSTSTYCHFSY